MKIGATMRNKATRLCRHCMLMQQVVGGGLKLSRMRRPRGVSRSNDKRPCPFLDLESTGDSGSERRPSSETFRQQAESALDSLPSEETVVGLKSFVNKEGNRKAELSQETVTLAP